MVRSAAEWGLSPEGTGDHQRGPAEKWKGRLIPALCPLLPLANWAQLKSPLLLIAPTPLVSQGPPTGPASLR